MVNAVVELKSGRSYVSDSKVPLQTFFVYMYTEDATHELQNRSLEELLERYGVAKCTDLRDRVYALLAIAQDCQHGSAFVADYEISRELLFFALMSFCQPAEPVFFARRLQEILEFRVDAITCLVQDPNAFIKAYTQPSPLSRLGLDYLEQLHGEFAYFLEHKAVGRSETWTQTCLFCVPELGGSKGPRVLDKLWRIGWFEVALILRPALAGYCLHGLAREIVNEGTFSWHFFDPSKDHEASGSGI